MIMEKREERMLRVVQGTKVYGGAQAINSVDFDIGQGEIHGLVGENGAGKSTLCKALAGAISLSSGDILLDGQKQTFATPADALKAGIVMVYQETSLIPTMTVAQNIILGREKIHDPAARYVYRCPTAPPIDEFPCRPNGNGLDSGGSAEANGGDRARCPSSRPAHHLR